MFGADELCADPAGEVDATEGGSSLPPLAPALWPSGLCTAPGHGLRRTKDCRRRGPFGTYVCVCVGCVGVPFVELGFGVWCWCWCVCVCVVCGWV